MTAYYPSQGSYSHHGHHHHGQPVVYSSSQAYGQPMVASSDYYQPGGVMYVPSSGSRRHHRHRDDRMPQVASVAAPVILVRYAACYLGLIRAHFELLIFFSSQAVTVATTITTIIHSENVYDDFLV